MPAGQNDGMEAVQPRPAAIVQTLATPSPVAESGPAERWGMLRQHLYNRCFFQTNIQTGKVRLGHSSCALAAEE
jgi:hypothetical protein